MCIVFSIIEYVYWCLRVIFIEYVRYWEFVCELSKIPWLFVLLCHIYFAREMSDLLLKALSHCHFHHYIHYWCDFTSCLIWVDHRLSSYIHCFAVIFIIVSLSFLSSFMLHLIHFTSCSLLTATHLGFDTHFASSFHISLSVHFASFVSLSTSYSQ